MTIPPFYSFCNFTVSVISACTFQLSPVIRNIYKAFLCILYPSFNPFISAFHTTTFKSKNFLFHMYVTGSVTEPGFVLQTPDRLLEKHLLLFRVFCRNFIYEVSVRSQGQLLMKNHLNSFYKTLDTMIRVTEVSLISLASRRYLRSELVVKNKQRSGPQTVVMKKVKT